MNLKEIYRKYSRFIQPVLYCKNRLFGIKIKSHGENNTIAGIGMCRAKNSTITISGSRNKVVIGDMSSLFGVSIYIHGNNNMIELGSRNFLNGAVFCVEDDNNRISTGEHTYIYNSTEISAVESTAIKIGCDCLLSSNIMIRSGDSHVILDKASGERINPSKDIFIGDHVWLGNGCTVLKGSHIGRDCVAATGTIITASTPQEKNVILAGVPSKIVRRGIDWTQQR